MSNSTELRFQDITQGRRKLALVLNTHWHEPAARLWLFSRPEAGDAWQTDLRAAEAVTGKAGMGWDSAFPLAEALDEDARIKREGDNRAPAGVLYPGLAFGYAPMEEIPFELNWPYLQVTEGFVGVDDPASRYYTCIVNERMFAEPDWNSAERMHREDGLYRYGLEIAYNHPPHFAPGRGSCIFWHLWRGAGQGTEGCTAMPEATLNKVLEWLPADEKPVIIQMPETAFRKWAELDPDCKTFSALL